MVFMNSHGRLIRQIKNIYNPTAILNRDPLPEGLYFGQLSKHSKVPVNVLLNIKTRMSRQINFTKTIKASPAIVWDYLTHPELLKQWIAEPDMKLEILTDWKVGHPFIIKGSYHGKFENKGIVLQFEPNKILRYNYLSSVSRLPDRPENHTIVEFRMAPLKDQTILTLTLSNFPTESIFKHVDFYWRATLEILKVLIENK